MRCEFPLGGEFNGTRFRKEKLVPPAILAAIIALIGNFLIQEWLHRRIRAAEELKNYLYNYLELSLNYWINEDSSASKRNNLEVRMAKQRIISTDFSYLSKRHTRVRFLQYRRWETLRKTKNIRQELWDTATGECFQQKKIWKTDPEGAMLAARLVSRLVEYID